ncbi:MAG: hypothetical protein QXD62_00620 [Candidatus Woesearchaeota archaeon]
MIKKKVKNNICKYLGILIVFLLIPPVVISQSKDCKLLKAENLLNKTFTYDCVNISESESIDKVVDVNISGVITKWGANRYEYSVEFKFFLNLNQSEYEKSVSVIGKKYSTIPTLNFRCLNATSEKITAETTEFFFFEKTIEIIDNQTNTSLNISIPINNIICRLEGIAILEQYIPPFELAIKDIKIVPTTKISVMKSFTIEDILRELNRQPKEGEDLRGVGVSFINENDHTLIYEFKIYREIPGSGENILQTLFEIFRGIAQVPSNHTLSINLKDFYYSNAIYWIEANPYYKLKYNITNNTILRIFTPPQISPISGGIWILEEITPDNVTKKNITEEEAQKYCIPVFNRKVSIMDVEKRIISVTYELINPCQDERKITIREPLPEGGALLELSEGYLINSIITIETNLKKDDKKTINYTVKLLIDDGLILYPSAIVSVENKTYIINTELLKLKPIISEVILVRKRIQFIENDLVRINLEAHNLGEKTSLFLKDIAKTYSSLTTPFFKHGTWKIDLLEREVWIASYVTKISEEIYSLPQVLGFGGKVFYTVISSTKTSEEIQITQQISNEYIYITIIIVGIIGLTTLTVIEILKSYNRDSWKEIEKSLEQLMKNIKK